MLEEGDLVEYETRDGTRRSGEVTIRGYAPNIWVGEAEYTILAARVRLLRVTRGGAVVAEVQGFASHHRARENNAKLQRLRAEFGTGVK
jgi:hypothetical protein